MKAIYKNELASYLRGLVGWTAIAVMLFMVGIYFTAYNLQSQLPYIGYALASISFMLIFVCPALSMRSFAEERRQKTDQLLLTAPVSVTSIVTGKYLAIVTVFAIPMAVVSIYPLILTQYGSVPMLQTYSTVLAFFLLGAACLAIGVFFSSITENQVIAFVSTVIVLMVCYLMNGIKNFSSSSSRSALVLFTVAALAASVLAWYLAKSFVLGAVIFVAMEAFVTSAVFFNSGWLAEAFDNVLAAFSLFSGFEGFLNGTLDISVYIYLISVIVLFNFFTIQVIEKRRWS